MSLLKLAPLAATAVLAACAGYAAGAGRAGEAIAGAQETAPKPAYMVVTGTVLKQEEFVEGYAKPLPALYAKHGGRYLAIGRDVTFLEGAEDFQSYVVAEWPSKEAALAFWDDPEYVALRDARINGGWGAFDVFLVEGLAAPTIVSPLVRD